MIASTGARRTSGIWGLRPFRARHELERCGTRLRADDVVDDAGGVAVVLGAVRGVDLVVLLHGLDEENVLVDAAGPDVAFLTLTGATEPGGRSYVAGSVVTVGVVVDVP